MMIVTGLGEKQNGEERENSGRRRARGIKRGRRIDRDSWSEKE